MTAASLRLDIRPWEAPPVGLSAPTIAISFLKARRHSGVAHFWISLFRSPDALGRIEVCDRRSYNPAARYFPLEQ